ncbi:MAG TPA: hypothetical protein VH143_17465 [Kofleriaceae bacterium]|jgi:hypothetical protein|nr:hypothetical protein [Kofleriaceae bacterium]
MLGYRALDVRDPVQAVPLGVHVFDGSAELDYAVVPNAGHSRS